MPGKHRIAPRRPALGTTRLLRRPRLLIVGCGDIGLRIVSRLQGRFRVTGVVSGEAGADRVRAAGARAVVLDLDLPRRRRRPIPPSTRVLHLAPTSGAGARDLRLLRVLREAGSRGRFVYISTTGVYGDRGGDWVDETSGVRPRNARAVRRLAAERAARGATRHASVLRVPGIYAADRLPLDRLRAGVPSLAPAEDVFTSHVHAVDLARACLCALERGAAARVYNAVDSSEMLLGEYLDLVADRFGLARAPRLPRAELTARIDPARLSFLSESRRIRNRRLLGELRLRLRYPDVREGIDEAARLGVRAADRFALRDGVRRGDAGSPLAREAGEGRG
jgi:nucleoside-diphosphate-sugar epimerase